MGGSKASLKMKGLQQKRVTYERTLGELEDELKFNRPKAEEKQRLKENIAKAKEKRDEVLEKIDAEAESSSWVLDMVRNTVDSFEDIVFDAIVRKEYKAMGKRLKVAMK